MSENLFKIILKTFIPPLASWYPRFYFALKRIDLNRENNILDAGCGNGETSIILAKSVSRVVGIDLSSEKIKSASRKAEKKRISAMFLRADLRKLPFAAESFDQIVSLDVLDAIDEDTKVLQEFYRVLKPSGRVVFSLPHQDFEMNRWPEQKLLRRLTPQVLYSKDLFNGKRWLEASRKDITEKLRRCRYYSLSDLKKKCDPFFEIDYYKIGMKRFSSLVMDLVYGVKGFRSLMPFLLFFAVRLDNLLPEDNEGHLLIAELKKK